MHAFARFCYVSIWRFVGVLFGDRQSIECLCGVSRWAGLGAETSIPVTAFVLGLSAPTDKPKLSFSPPTGIWRCGGGTAKKCSANLISRTFCTPMWWSLPCESLKFFQICTERAMFTVHRGKMCRRF